MVLTRTANEITYYSDTISAVGDLSWAMNNYLTLKIELDQEDDGRWIADIADLPGVMVYGKTGDDAIEKVKALAAAVIIDQQTHGERHKDLYVSYVIS